MSLIVISAVGRDPGPVFICAFHSAKDLLKTQNPAKQFRTESHFSQKTTLQLPTANAHIAGQLVYRNLTSTPHDLRNRVPQRRALFFFSLYAPDQQSFNNADLLWQFANIIYPPGKFPIQRPCDVRKRSNAIGQLVWRNGKKRQRASRSETDSEQLDRAGGGNQDRLCHL